ncbi:MAG: hypothetical protein H6623_02425 [Bdellovibrionaceae bacterium]|nr:hypothetical protein [Pseudobdellovibrionaceae bacterium]
MHRIFKIILSLSLITMSPDSFGDEIKTACETAINCTITNGNTTTTTATPGKSTGGTTINRGVSGMTTTTTTTNYGSAGAGGSGAYNQAQNAKNKASDTKAAAMAMAAAMMAACRPPYVIVPCILAPLAMMAAQTAGSKENDAQNVMNSLGVGGSTSGTTADTKGTTDSAQMNAELARIKADLAKKGVIANADGSTTLPNGQTVASNLNDQSLKAAGLSNSDINNLKSTLANMKKDLNGSKSATPELNTASVAGGYDGGRVRIDSEGDISGDTRKTASVDPERTQVDKDASKWQGFFTQFGDSQIGVAQSDIFLMIEKRVDQERKVMGQ